MKQLFPKVSVTNDSGLCRIELTEWFNWKLVSRVDGAARTIAQERDRSVKFSIFSINRAPVSDLQDEYDEPVVLDANDRPAFTDPEGVKGRIL